MMKLPRRKLILYGSLFISAVCLGAGLALAGQSLVGLAALIPAGITLWSMKPYDEAKLTAALGIAVLLGGYGLLANASAFLMMLGVSMALAGWDLASLNARIDDSKPGASRMEQRHLLALGPAVGLGILVSAAGQLIRIQIPFIILLVLVGAALFIIERVIVAMRG